MCFVVDKMSLVWTLQLALEYFTEDKDRWLKYVMLCKFNGLWASLKNLEKKIVDSWSYFRESIMYVSTIYW